MRKLSTVQNGGFPNIFSFHIIHYTLFSSLKNICNKKDFHVARQTCWWKRPFHVGCQDKSGPGKIHEVILVFQRLRTWSTVNAYVKSDDRKYLLWVLSVTAPFIWNAEYYRIGVRSVTAVSTYLYIFPNGEQSQSRLFGKLVGTVSRLPIQERYVWFRFIYQEKHFQIMQSSFPFPFHIKYPSS